jgi:fructokinase
MRPIIFGEVLYDIFPDGREILGGAPFNVAWHLKGFGQNPLMITRVGVDSLGDRILEQMCSWGMDTGQVQLDRKYPTGTVLVSFDDQEPRFEIPRQQAFDYIDPHFFSAGIDPQDNSPLYHGSLAARSEISASALACLRANDSRPAFVDINLRQPWWTESSAVKLISGSRWLKLNLSELKTLADPSPATGADIRHTARKFVTVFSLETCIVTMGSEGAVLIDATGAELHLKPPLDEEIVDTVGAGDAFSAVMLNGIMNGWGMTTSLERAIRFAADICAIRGATTSDTRLYAAHLNKWEAMDNHGI